MHKIFLIILIGSTFSLTAQNTLKVSVDDSLSHEKLVGVAIQIEKTSIGNVTDEKGMAVIENIPNEKHLFNVSLVGYHLKQLELSFPRKDDAPLSISLVAEDNELETTLISATRTNSRIEDIATKVEVLGADDMLEENSIKPSNIASILGDLSVIHIQQTSAVSGAASVRMQGLDGKYTQILRDGLPLYEGFSGSFGVLQIPPLDLKQVEIIKGSNSTLYGGGAIGGMINLVSKEPSDKTDASLTLNQSTLKESNANVYFAKRFGKIGITTFVGSTFQKAVDVNGDGFSDVPSVRGIVVHPRLFAYFNPNTTLKLGFNGVFENRNGGDLIAVNEAPTASHSFFEKNKSIRESVDFNFLTEKDNHHIGVKGVISQFDRLVNQSGFKFQGVQKSVYTEGSDFIKLGKHDLVFGVNYIEDAFKKTSNDTSKINNYDNRTVGVFIQDGWQIASKWFVEMGIRNDFLNNEIGQNKANASFLLPRVALLYKPNHDFTVRLAIGSGYKVPNVFTAQALSGSFKEIPPLSINVVSERSNSLNGDINYHILWGSVGIWLNQAFYYTHISKSVIIQDNALRNADFVLRSIGSDTYLRLSYADLELYFGYNHTLSDAAKKPVLLAPRDKIALTAAYEIEGEWRFGIEASWVGNQYLSETLLAPNYWFWAGMVERKFGEHISLVLNCENLFDARQSRNESLYTGSIQNPIFKSVYMPIDGRIVNLALRLKL